MLAFSVLLQDGYEISFSLFDRCLGPSFEGFGCGLDRAFGVHAAAARRPRKYLTRVRVKHINKTLGAVG